MGIETGRRRGGRQRLALDLVDRLAGGEAERKLLKAVPAAYRLNAHHWLILHGRYICKARRPECWRCPVADLCAHRPKSAPPPQRSALDATPSADAVPSAVAVPSADAAAGAGGR